jgi:hypothetical protein
MGCAISWNCCARCVAALPNDQRITCCGLRAQENERLKARGGGGRDSVKHDEGVSGLQLCATK